MIDWNNSSDFNLSPEGLGVAGMYNIDRSGLGEIIFRALTGRESTSGKDYRVEFLTKYPDKIRRQLSKIIVGSMGIEEKHYAYTPAGTEQLYDDIFRLYAEVKNKAGSG